MTTPRCCFDIDYLGIIIQFRVYHRNAIISTNFFKIIEIVIVHIRDFKNTFEAQFFDSIFRFLRRILAFPAVGFGVLHN